MNMQKIFYVDTETTGLDPNVNGMIEIAALVEVNGVVIDTIKLEMNPYSYSKPVVVSPEALEVNGRTMEELPNLPDAKAQFKLFIEFLDRHIDRFNRDDKFKVCGYNSAFDIGFITAWFADNSHMYYGSYFFRKDLDVFALVRHLTHFGLLNTPDEKLGTLCDFFGIQHDEAHTALSDIKATRELYMLLRRMLGL
jgi:DNA polymerase-3 subunit epsilon